MLKKRFRVLITTNIPSPYMVAYLNELQKTCDVTALFERKKAFDRKEQWISQKSSFSFQYRFLKGVPFGKETAFCPGAIFSLKRKKYDIIIIANPTTPTGVLLLLHCRLFRIPFCIQSEGGFQGSGKGMKEKFKKYIMKKARLFFSGMGGENDYFLSYGGTSETIWEYPFSSLYDRDVINSLSLMPANKNDCKKIIGVKESKMIMTVGRFSYNRGYGKGYDIVLRVAEKSAKDIGFYIIGDEPTKEFLNWKKEKRLDNVHFISFLNKDELQKYYMAADLFVLMTRGDTWGLVINEAMCYCLPIITTDKCVAGTVLIKNGINGFVINIDDEKDIFDKIDSSITNDELVKRTIEYDKEIIRKYTIENMTKSIYEGICYYVSKYRRE